MLNKNKISYRFNDESLNKKDIAEELIKNILVKATPMSSCWWGKMKTRTDGFKSLLDSIKHKQVKYLKTGEDFVVENGATAKTCPGIVGLFQQAFLIKSPTDIVITIDSEGGVVYDVSDNSIIRITQHGKEQFYQDDNQLFKNKASIKFELLVSVKTTGFEYIITDPTYHNNSGCFVPTGFMSSAYSNNQELNLITLIDIPKKGETKTISITNGDVLGYLIPFKKCSLEFSEDNFIAKRFYKTFQKKRVF